MNLSPLAIQQTRRTDRITRRVPWGFLLHTTGGGVPLKAGKQGRSPVDVALEVYRAMQGATGGQGSEGYPWGGPAYLIGHHGEIHQIADDDIETYHAGGPDRAAYLDGSWTSRASKEVVDRWRVAWPGVASPQHLYPGTTANAPYVGAEMIPCAIGMGTPMRPGLKFTKAQHDAAIELGRDLAARHAWPAGWAHSPRLLGHEDVQPLERSDAGGGWDCGWLRANPYFDFEYVRSRIDGATPT